MGVSLSNAHCSAPACEPTRASLFSGLRPSTSGCYLNGHLWKKYVKEGICLNAHFKDSGYYVMGTGKTYHASGTSKAAIYENEWHEYPRLPKSSTGGASKFQGYFEPLPLKMKDEDLGDWHSVNYCIEQLGKKRDKPFFLACGLIKPHLPWAVPQKYYDMFPRDTIKLPPLLENDFSDIPKFAHGVGTYGDLPSSSKAGAGRMPSSPTSRPSPSLTFASVACSIPSRRARTRTTPSSSCGGIMAGTSGKSSAGASSPSGRKPLGPP